MAVTDARKARDVRALQPFPGEDDGASTTGADLGSVDPTEIALRFIGLIDRMDPSTGLLHGSCEATGQPRDTCTGGHCAHAAHCFVSGRQRARDMRRAHGKILAQRARDMHETKRIFGYMCGGLDAPPRLLEDLKRAVAGGFFTTKVARCQPGTSAPLAHQRGSPTTAAMCMTLSPSTPSSTSLRHTHE